MNNFLLLLLGFTLSFPTYAQIGINTANPKGTLDITTKNNTGLVLPRVSSIEAVTDGMGNLPVNGTTVYDISRGKTCFYTNDKWLCLGIDGTGEPILTDETAAGPRSTTYVKASNTEAGGGDEFGISLSLSGDGNTLAVSAYNEGSSTTGINGDELDNSASGAGAVYLFIRTAGVWSQEAYIKASNTDSNDDFGYSVSLNGDGNTLAVGASNEGSSAKGIDGDQTNNSNSGAGAVYVFTRTAGVWSQEAYVKASNTNAFDHFGVLVDLSTDGNTLAVGANGERSNVTGINSTVQNNSAAGAGAVYVFTRSAGVWSQEAYIKASNTGVEDRFGEILSLSGDGNTLAVSSVLEDSDATGINGNQTNNNASGSGAVYVFTRSAGLWSQQAYVKASNTGAGDEFGHGLSLNSDGTTMAVGAYFEESNAKGTNGDETNNSTAAAGAVYVFTQIAGVWSQEAYIKASNTEDGTDGDEFGFCVSLSSDGNLLAVGAGAEASNATELNGDEADNTAPSSGAAYIFKRKAGVWGQQAYIKASNTDEYDYFGTSISISSDGNTWVIGAYGEASTASGIDGDQTNNAAYGAGAVYISETP